MASNTVLPRVALCLGCWLPTALAVATVQESPPTQEARSDLARLARFGIGLHQEVYWLLKPGRPSDADCSRAADGAVRDFMSSSFGHRCKSREDLPHLLQDLPEETPSIVLFTFDAECPGTELTLTCRGWILSLDGANVEQVECVYVDRARADVAKSGADGRAAAISSAVRKCLEDDIAASLFANAWLEAGDWSAPKKRTTALDFRHSLAPSTSIGATSTSHGRNP